MPILEILKEPDPRLRRKAKPVDAVTDDIRSILDDMLETMYHAHGMGLAAVQVNIHKRLVVMDLGWSGDDGDQKTCTPLKMVNPEILWASENKTPLNEGCLSVPELRGEVMRPDAVRFQYLDENGESQEVEVDGLMAKCIQHEIDHLNGKLYIDYFSPLKRQMALKKLTKIKRFEKQDALS